MGLVRRVAARVAARLAEPPPARADVCTPRGPCPQCGAGPEQRDDASPFGPTRTWICTRCAFDFSQVTS